MMPKTVSAAHHWSCGASLILFAMVFLGACGGRSEPVAPPAPTVTNSFEHDIEGWYAYDYTGPEDTYWKPTLEQSGGVNNSGYIWADESRWRIDEPENPDSILPLMTYLEWREKRPPVPGAAPVHSAHGKIIDLKNAVISFHLRGDNLDLKGASCFFWINTTKGNRYHMISYPLQVPKGIWSPRQQLTLKPDPLLWHHSWSIHTHQNIEQALSDAESYGFSFVGFRKRGVPPSDADEPTGRFAVDEFQIRPAAR